MWIQLQKVNVQSHLVVISHTAIRSGCSDFWCGSSQVTGGHDARFSDSKTEDQVVSPQRDVAVTRAYGVSLFGVYRAATRR